MAGLQPHKGIWHILDGLAALKKKGLNFELHVWGPHQHKAPPEIAARGLEDRVHLRGVFTHAQRWDVYAEIDMAIMATTWPEPFGRIVGEAAAAGVPTIAPAVGGLTEQFDDDRSGLLYGFRDAAHLQRQMERILTEPTLYPRLLQNLPAVLDTRAAVSSLERFYFGALGRRSSEQANSMLPAAQ
jgi:glycosyltransferase involved in cell wall biosynthesis